MDRAFAAFVIALAILGLAAALAPLASPAQADQVIPRRLVVVRGEKLRCLVAWNERGGVGRDGALAVSCVPDESANFPITPVVP